MKSINGTTFPTSEARWQAVINRDRSADGRFVYGVKTTGVYCRPTCVARRAKRENVEFHLTPADAQRAGFRACKRCKPDEPVAHDRLAGALAKACDLIAKSEKLPGLGALAAAAKMSPSYFHRVFKSQTGLTPKAYAAAHRAQRVRQELSHNGTVTSAIYKSGFNSNGRFYATSARLLGMKPKTFQARGTGMRIRFAVGKCSLGSILVASSDIGVCAIMLGDVPSELARELQNRFSNAQLIRGDKSFERVVAKVIAFVERPAKGLDLPLDVQGTAFQHRVWQQLCKIPCGETRSYSQVAQRIGRPTATRAVAQACAANPVAVAVPCHRVVRTDGSLSGYRWGLERKAKLLKAEDAPR